MIVGLTKCRYSGILFWAISVALFSLSCTGPKTKPTQTVPVHAVTDLSHQFSFYADGRFYKQYLPEQKGVTNWGALSRFDFSNANLLILLGCDDRISYTPGDVTTIKSFLEDGGGVVVFGEANTTSQNKLLENFGARFNSPASYPLTGTSEINQQKIEGEHASVLTLKNADQWDALVVDSTKKPVIARQEIGKGNLLVASRALAGHQPNARDSINQKMWKPLLSKIVSGKTVDTSKVFEGRGMDDLAHTEDHKTFTLSYTDYLKPYAKAMVDVYNRALPHIRERMGVPLSPGMAKKIVLLPTGGGGFSTGNTLGLAVWWGGFPKKEDSMIEFVTHESVHSWVLPFAEVWNEPIATYVGDLVMMDMGHLQEAMKRIQHTISRAKKYDPEMKNCDIHGNLTGEGKKLNVGQQNDVHWGKTFWVFEQLRKKNPDIIADYFKMKRKYATEDAIAKYDMNNTVAVLSLAMGKDLNCWFNQHGMKVDKNKAEIKI